MSILAQNPSDSDGKITEVVQSVVPTEVADEIRADAVSEERSVSLVICRVLKRHYAKRLKARAAQQRRAA